MVVALSTGAGAVAMVAGAFSTWAVSVVLYGTTFLAGAGSVVVAVFLIPLPSES